MCFRPTAEWVKVSSVSVEVGGLTNIDDDLDENVTSKSRLRRSFDYKTIREDISSNTSVPSHFMWRRDDRSDEALAQLKSISQPQENEDVDQYEEYKYDTRAGLDSTVYIIDTGATPNHDVRRYKTYYMIVIPIS